MAFEPIELECPTCSKTSQVDPRRLTSTAPYVCGGCSGPLQVEMIMRTTKEPTILRAVSGDISIEHIVHQLPDGIWISSSESELSIINSIELSTDRAAAIIAGSLVEDRLTKAIKSKLLGIPEADENLFRTSGPLGTFSAKIDLAVSMGVISLIAYKEMKNLKDIRNLFAHNLEIRDFNDQKPKALANNLHLIDKHLIDVDESEPWKLSLNYDLPRMTMPRLSVRRLFARERYVMTAHLFAVCLSLASSGLYENSLI